VQPSAHDDCRESFGFRLHIQSGRHSNNAPTKRKTSSTRHTVAAQRAIQKQVARADRTKRAKQRPAHMGQTGARRYPYPPFRQPHQIKPGSEATLIPSPLYDAPFYRGSDKLKDKVAIVTCADSGIGRAVSVLFAREGADVAALYLDEHEDAQTTRAAVEREGRRCELIAGDVGFAAKRLHM